jgi:hypothetical protein
MENGRRQKRAWNIGRLVTITHTGGNKYNITVAGSAPTGVRVLSETEVNVIYTSDFDGDTTEIYAILGPEGKWYELKTGQDAFFIGDTYSESIASIVHDYKNSLMELMIDGE